VNHRQRVIDLVSDPAGHHEARCSSLTNAVRHDVPR
jgi:hypothetical protein